ncbi:hypothetical protein, partial [Klebsiella pneumoniae]|uniref:hypothetical protein n=1 Tax=Klebsiella pneumoniae TaxID=573 RepID=UPI001D0D66FD
LTRGCNPTSSKFIHTWLRFGEIMRGSLRAQRKEKRDIASKHLSHCIAVLEELVDTYDPDTEGPFSACHPRTGAASMKRQLENILKALKTAKV